MLHLYIDPEYKVSQCNEVPVLYNILPQFLVSLCLMVDAGELFSHSLLLFKLLFSVYFLLLCLQAKYHYDYLDYC